MTNHFVTVNKMFSGINIVLNQEFSIPFKKPNKVLAKKSLQKLPNFLCQDYVKKPNMHKIFAGNGFPHHLNLI